MVDLLGGNLHRSITSGKRISNKGITQVNHLILIRPFTVASIRKTFCTRRHNKQSMLHIVKEENLFSSSNNALWQRLII
jgi:hypothetical protein